MDTKKSFVTCRNFRCSQWPASELDSVSRIGKQARVSRKPRATTSSFLDQENRQRRQASRNKKREQSSWSKLRGFQARSQNATEQKLFRARPNY